MLSGMKLARELEDAWCQSTETHMSTQCLQHKVTNAAWSPMELQKRRCGRAIIEISRPPCLTAAPSNSVLVARASPLGPSVAEHAHQALCFLPAEWLAWEPCLFNQSCHPCRSTFFELRKQAWKHLSLIFPHRGSMKRPSVSLSGFQHCFLRKYCLAHPSVLMRPYTQSIDDFPDPELLRFSQLGTLIHTGTVSVQCAKVGPPEALRAWASDTCLQRCLPRHPNGSW